MQGQRGTVGSLPETLDFDLGSSSNNAAMDQQMCWNNLRTPPENRIPDYLLSPNDVNMAFVNSMSRERQSLNLSRRCPNEASSSNTQTELGHDERKLELGWPSSGSCPVAGPRLAVQRRDAASSVMADNSVNLMFPQSSNSIPVQPSLNLGFGGHGGSNTQVMPFPNAFKFGASESEQICPTSGSDHFLLPPGRAGFLVSENDGRQGSMEGTRLPCKRKGIEGSVGPSSSSGSCSYVQRTDCSARPGLPSQSGTSSSLSIGTPRLGLGFPDIPSVAENHEGLRRNVRLRTSSLTQQNSIAPMLSASRALRRSNHLSSQPSMSLLPVEHSLDLIRPVSALDNTPNPAQFAAIDAPPPLPQNAHSLRWSAASSRNGASSSTAAHREELGLRSMARTVTDHPIPATELRNLVRHPAIRSVAGGSINMIANSGSTTSRAGGSNSNVNPPLAPAWPQPQHNPPAHYPRRFSEYLRRSLFNSIGAEPGGQNSNSLPPPLPGQAGPSQEVVPPVGGGGHGHRLAQARLASLLERHNESGLGVPYSLRGFGAGGEGSGRLVSEIRNVLGLLRRGESLRFEDVMILDPAVFAGMADIHDRHRDMRLDVDNMSYEELLALEERIGNVNTGLSEETILKRLKQQKKYFISGKSSSENEPCCICQEDYNQGENVGTLECGHDFHTDCIKQWLTHKNLCPICKTTAMQS